MSKTCGECKYYFRTDRYEFCNEFGNQTGEYREVTPNSYCFELKPPPTNGDKIRSMSNEELAPLLVYTIRVAGGLKFMYSSHLIDDCYHEKEKAIQATVAKLNEVCK